MTPEEEADFWEAFCAPSEYIVPMDVADVPADGIVRFEIQLRQPRSTIVLTPIEREPGHEDA